MNEVRGISLSDINMCHLATQYSGPGLVTDELTDQWNTKQNPEVKLQLLGKGWEEI